MCATAELEESWHSGKDETLKVLQTLKVLFKLHKKLHSAARQLIYELHFPRCMGHETARCIGRRAYNCEDATFD